MKCRCVAACALRVLLLGAGCFGTTATTAGAVGLQTRPADPIVLAGTRLPTLVGTPPQRVVAFRWAGNWQQVAVQVDERANIDLAKAYNQPPAG
jgi:hypothetical protein